MTTLKAHPDAELTTEQTTALYQLLVGKQAELVEQADNLEKVITRKEDCSLADPVEASFYRAEANRAEVLVQQNRETLRDIVQALKRLEDGVYGISIVSGEPIPYARLALLPWTPYCTGDLE